MPLEEMEENFYLGEMFDFDADDWFHVAVVKRLFAHGRILKSMIETKVLEQISNRENAEIMSSMSLLYPADVQYLPPPPSSTPIPQLISRPIWAQSNDSSGNEEITEQPENEDQSPLNSKHEKRQQSVVMPDVDAPADDKCDYSTEFEQICKSKQN